MKNVWKVTLLVNAKVNTIENGINEVKTESHYIEAYYDGTQYDAVMKATLNCKDPQYIDYKIFGINARQGRVFKSEPMRVIEVIEVDPSTIICK